MKWKTIHLLHVLYILHCNGVTEISPCARHLHIPSLLIFNICLPSIPRVNFKFLNSICEPTVHSWGLSCQTFTSCWRYEWWLRVTQCRSRRQQSPHWSSVSTFTRTSLSVSLWSWQTAQTGRLSITQMLSKYTLRDLLKVLHTDSKSVFKGSCVCDAWLLDLWSRSHVAPGDNHTVVFSVQVYERGCYWRKEEIEEDKKSFALASLSEQASRV